MMQMVEKESMGFYSLFLFPWLIINANFPRWGLLANEEWPGLATGGRDFIKVALHCKELSLGGTVERYQSYVRPKCLFNWFYNPSATSTAHVHMHGCALVPSGPRVQPDSDLWPWHVYIHTYILKLILKRKGMEKILTSNGVGLAFSFLKWHTRNHCEAPSCPWHCIQHPMIQEAERPESWKCRLPPNVPPTP